MSDAQRTDVRLDPLGRRRRPVRAGPGHRREARAYLVAVTDVAAGSNPSTALSVLLLAVSQVLLAGARLGAISDVVPQSRFEPDPGPEPDVDPLHAGLANALEGIDDYGEIFDPMVPGGVVHGSLSGDLAEVAVGAGPRPAPLRGRPGRRGAVVVAVQLPVVVGAAGGQRAARRPVDPRPPAAGRRRGGRRGRRVRRPATCPDRPGDLRRCTRACAGRSV